MTDTTTNAAQAAAVEAERAGKGITADTYNEALQTAQVIADRIIDAMPEERERYAARLQFNDIVKDLTPLLERAEARGRIEGKRAGHAAGVREGREREQESRKSFNYSSYGTAQFILMIDQPGGDAPQWIDTARQIIANPDAETVESVGKENAALLALEDALKDHYRDRASEAKDATDSGELKAMIEAGFCEVNFQEVARHILDTVQQQDEDEAENERERQAQEAADKLPKIGDRVQIEGPGYSAHRGEWFIIEEIDDHRAAGREALAKALEDMGRPPYWYKLRRDVTGKKKTAKAYATRCFWTPRQGGFFTPII